MTPTSTPSQTRTVRGRLGIAAVAAATATWLLSGGVAAAHPHHAPGSSNGLAAGFFHPMLGWDHLLAMVAIGVLAAFAPNRRLAWATPAMFVVGMVAGGAIGLSTGALATTEVLIAVSLLALGTLIVFAANHLAWWLPGAAALFGAVHGQAHGAEIPAGALPLGYVVGFVAATALLHAAGATTALVLRDVPATRWVTGSLVTFGGLLALGGV